MNESELYKELGVLTKEKDKWEESIPYVSSLLSHDSVKIKAKTLWLLGEMGLVYPLLVQDAVPEIASFCDSSDSLLRERAVNALGRIGRGNYQVIESYWTGLFRFAYDEEPKVCLTVAHSCNCFSSCSALSCADRTMLCESARDRSLFYFFCYQALFLLHKPGVKRMTLGLFHFCPKSAIIQSAKGRQLMMTMWYSPSRTGRKSRYRE